MVNNMGENTAFGREACGDSPIGMRVGTSAVKAANRSDDAAELLRHEKRRRIEHRYMDTPGSPKSYAAPD